MSFVGKFDAIYSNLPRVGARAFYLAVLQLLLGSYSPYETNIW
jgi:hypothetical protein